jgi:excinuclease ABC subunit B
MVIMYADNITQGMSRAIEETERRRRIQMDYNRKMGITPKTISKSIKDIMGATSIADSREEYERVTEYVPDYGQGLSDEEILVRMEADMRKFAEELEFEKAAKVRDELVRLHKELNIPWEFNPDL